MPWSGLSVEGMSPSLGGVPFNCTRCLAPRSTSFFSVAAILDRFLQKRPKRFAERGQIDPILRALRSGHARLHIGQIELEIDAVIDLAFARHAEHFLRAKIIFERGALFVGAAGRAQIIYRFLIDREKSHRRAVLRATCCRSSRDPAPAATPRLRRKTRQIFRRLLRAQHLRDVQHEIGRGHAFAQSRR